MKFFPLIVRRLLGQFARAIERSNVVSAAGASRSQATCPRLIPMCGFV
jgi:hypothetical protein